MNVMCDKWINQVSESIAIEFRRSFYRIEKRENESNFERIIIGISYCRAMLRRIHK